MSDSFYQIGKRFYGKTNLTHTEIKALQEKHFGALVDAGLNNEKYPNEQAGKDALIKAGLDPVNYEVRPHYPLDFF